MKTLEEFYQTELLPDLEKLEEQRRIAKKKLVPIVVVVGLINLGCLILLVKTALPLALMLIPLCFSILPILAWYAKYYKGYKDQFKNTIISKIIAFIDPHLHYDKDDMVPKDEFINSRLFAEHPDSYRGDDLVTGTIGQTAIKFSEIQVIGVK